MRYSEADFWYARALMDQGVALRAVAREIGASYTAIRYWRDLDHPPRMGRTGSFADWRPQDPEAYCYLLGLYLGDGCLGQTSRNAVQLVLTLDARYPGIIEEAASAMEACIPEARVGQCQAPGAVRVYASHPAWLAAFPQHGPGRKHTRRITLADWQSAFTCAQPERLLRGLIHSDGSRVINRFTTTLPSGRVRAYSYVRYFFTNYSTDIRHIFCDHCELVGVRWTQSSFKNISVAHRDSVAKLDEFIGPKS